ncbi:hypothetical protein J7E96_03345 [Streptomyces sp. ISL-96]|uniref:hypothetical protein n=1 Tax=Streptomyces sp. ISL-96 TaxID=2819191 RepID=UPI001BE595AA|nr:hypothetical protein [Streptomyces sp. ISL-96]MBT2487583.1 hypothetical protein [Streptomyces sp. ISL-96]
MSTPEPAAYAVISTRAQWRLATLPPEAYKAVEGLRQELEHTPRLGLPLGEPSADGRQVFKTRLEARAGMPGLVVLYLYLPQPPPPGVTITTVLPDESQEQA